MMKSVMSVLVVILMTGCALNPRLENQESFNGKVVRAKIKSMAGAKAGFEAHSREYGWYKEMVPNHKPFVEGDALVFFNTDEGAGGWLRGRMLEDRLMRQYAVVRVEQLKADPVLGKSKVGDIIDVQMPTWDHSTKSRSADITIIGVVCRKSDSDCIDKRALCLGIVNPITDSACN